MEYKYYSAKFMHAFYMHQAQSRKVVRLEEIKIIFIDLKCIMLKAKV